MTSTLIGRDHPAAVLDAEIERVSTSHGGLVLVAGEAPDAGADGPDGFRLYDAVTTALVDASQRRPVVVVLDDLHWADAASVRLLEFVVRHTWFERLLLIGTYRDTEVEGADHPLGPPLAALAAKATVVTLTGLGPIEVGRLMYRTVGRTPDQELTTEVHRRTGGNPFFVEQTARLWHGGATVTAIAPGVRDTVQRRLSLLAPPVVRMLTAAACSAVSSTEGCSRRPRTSRCPTWPGCSTRRSPPGW